MRQRPDGVTLVAIYQFVTAVFLLLGSCIILAFGIPVIFLAPAPFANPSDGLVLLLLLCLAMGALLAMGVASAVVGWGMLKQAPWARTGGILLGIPALLGFPVWTIAAVIVIVYLSSDEARAAFDVAPAAEVPTIGAPLPPPAASVEETREIEPEPRSE